MLKRYWFELFLAGLTLCGLAAAWALFITDDLL